MSAQSVLEELKALEDKLRGIKAPNGEQNGHNFHKGKSRTQAIQREQARAGREAK